MSDVPSKLASSQSGDNQGGSMYRLAYSIDTAADRSPFTGPQIAVAIRDGLLNAYRVEGNAILLPEDFHAWVKSHPKF